MKHIKVKLLFKRPFSFRRNVLCISHLAHTKCTRAKSDGYCVRTLSLRKMGIFVCAKKEGSRVHYVTPAALCTHSIIGCDRVCRLCVFLPTSSFSSDRIDPVPVKILTYKNRFIFFFVMAKQKQLHLANTVLKEENGDAIFVDGHENIRFMTLFKCCNLKPW